MSDQISNLLPIDCHSGNNIKHLPTYLMSNLFRLSCLKKVSLKIRLGPATVKTQRFVVFFRIDEIALNLGYLSGRFQAVEFFNKPMKA